MIQFKYERRIAHKSKQHYHKHKGFRNKKKPHNIEINRDRDFKLLDVNDDHLKEIYWYICNGSCHMGHYDGFEPTPYHYGRNMNCVGIPKKDILLDKQYVYSNKIKTHYVINKETIYYPQIVYPGVSFIRFDTLEEQMKHISWKYGMKLLFNEDNAFANKFISNNNNNISCIFKLINDRSCMDNYINDIFGCLKRICNYNTKKKYIAILYKRIYVYKHYNDIYKFLIKLKHMYCEYYKYYYVEQINCLQYHDEISSVTKCVYVILKHQYRYTKKIICKLIFFYLIK